MTFREGRREALVCSQLAPEYQALVYTEKRPCDVCGTELDVSESGLRHLAENPALVPVCTACAIRESEPHQKAKISDEVRQQAAEALGVPREVIDREADQYEQTPMIEFTEDDGTWTKEDL